jgi:hypothetical protein
LRYGGGGRAWKNMCNSRDTWNIQKHGYIGCIMLRVGQRRKFVRLAGGTGGSGGGSFPSFFLPLDDLGNGIVNTVPAIALGSAVPTFTRASVAWTKLPSGLWGQVATGIARATYLARNTAVGAYGGYWSEPAGVQLVTPTAAIRDMTDPSWIAVGITSVKTATGIDGVPNVASTLTATAPNGTILQTLVAAASARDYSVFLRRKTGSGVVLIQQGVTTLDVTAQLNTVTYTRVELNASVLNSAFGIQIAASGDVIEADFNQFEALTATQFASSPMVTTGAARAADVMSFVQTGNYDVTQGTAYAELSTNWTTTPVNAVAIGLRTLYVGSAGASTVIQSTDGTFFPSAVGLTSMNGVVRKRASSWGAAGLFDDGDGAVPSNTAFDGAMQVAPLGIGCNSTGIEQFNGTLKNVQIRQAQVTSAQLQALTA